MARYNLRVTSFGDGATTFTASTANGVYVVRGSASGADVVKRIMPLPYGGVHDLDGTADAPRRPPEVWQEFLFANTSPYAHPQYNTLESMLGHHGTVNWEIPTASTPVTFSAVARLIEVTGELHPPYRTNKRNWLFIRATWQLKAYPA